MRETLIVLSIVAAAAAAHADPPAPADGAIRVATYNVSMYRGRAGQLAAELRSGRSPKSQRIAEVIQRVRPDVLLLCEIDYEASGDPPRLFAERFVAEPQAAGLRGVSYPHVYSAPVNTGVPSGLDLDADGQTDGPADAWGFGRYPGQYGMAVLSRFPIDREATRTFQRLKWSELPAARRPAEPDAKTPFYSQEVWSELRLPSKSFWDVLVSTPGGGALHLLCSHPTPPVFDGPEDRNGCRNADEIALLEHYTDGSHGEYFVDDQGRRGALNAEAAFVVLGDLNADPNDGDRTHEAINDLLKSPRLATSTAPTSRGAVAAAAQGANLNSTQRGEAAEDTANFGQDGVANLRVDYALASSNLEVLASGVFWPEPGEPGADAAGASDHRLVWIDVAPAERASGDE